MSALRVLWICWCLGWAAAWAAVAAAEVPHRVCTLPMLFTIGNGPSCAGWGHAGSFVAVALFASLAILSLAAAFARLGRS